MVDVSEKIMNLKGELDDNNKNEDFLSSSLITKDIPEIQQHNELNNNEGNISNSQRDLIDSRVFDVYVNNAGTQNLQLMDIFYKDNKFPKNNVSILRN